MNRRRILAGLITGLLAALFMIGLVTFSNGMNPNAVTITDLGGGLRLLVAGALMGISYAFLFLPQPGGYATDITSGMVLGITAWVVLDINIFPLAGGSTPMWNVMFSGEIFPKLIAAILQGALTGLLYGLVFVRLRLITGPSQPASETKPRNIVIIGGGYAGVAAAETLDKIFMKDPSVIISLVSKINYLVHTPMLSEVSSSAVNAQNISPPLRSFFKKVRVIQSEVETVDWDESRIILTPSKRNPHEVVPFDHLLITAGGVPNFFGNKEVEANTLTFKSLADSMRLRNQVINLFETADFESDSARKRQMLTFVVVGGGFAGVELIGGLNDFGRGMLANYPNLRQEDLRFVLIHTQEIILPELSRELGLFAQEKMTARGIEFMLNTRVTSARPGAVQMDDQEIAADTVIWTAGNRPSPVIAKLGVEVSQRGQIPVAATLQSAERPNLWAAGDCAQIPDPDNEGSFFPPTAQHASREGKILGKNVAAALHGEALQPFKFKTLGSLAALGHQLAVAEIFGFRFSGFLAWLMWRAIYLSKLPNFEKQLRVLFDWVLDIFFPPDIVQTTIFGESEADE